MTIEDFRPKFKEKDLVYHYKWRRELLVVEVFKSKPGETHFYGCRYEERECLAYGKFAEWELVTKLGSSGNKINQN